MGTNTTNGRRDAATRFMEDVEKRTNMILAQLEKLQKSSNRAMNDYSPEQVEAVFGTIELELAKVKASFVGLPSFVMPMANGAAASKVGTE